MEKTKSFETNPESGRAQERAAHDRSIDRGLPPWPRGSRGPRGGGGRARRPRGPETPCRRRSGRAAVFVLVSFCIKGETRTERRKTKTKRKRKTSFRSSPDAPLDGSGGRFLTGGPGESRERPRGLDPRARPQRCLSFSFCFRFPSLCLRFAFDAKRNQNENGRRTPQNTV